MLNYMAIIQEDAFRELKSSLDPVLKKMLITRAHGIGWMDGKRQVCLYQNYKYFNTKVFSKVLLKTDLTEQEGVPSSLKKINYNYEKITEMFEKAGDSVENFMSRKEDELTEELKKLENKKLAVINWSEE